MEENQAEIFPAATVVLLRKRPHGFEVLLLKRNPDLAYLGGAWVFPGGRIDKVDYTDNECLVHTAKRAAIREAQEEAGLKISGEELVLVSKWVTPKGMPKRFSTWFFMALANGGKVKVDGGEIHEHKWISPENALAYQRAGEIELPPAIFVTLYNLAGYGDAETAIRSFEKIGVPVYNPRLVPVPGGFCSLYEKDTAYSGGDINGAGVRHRLWMLNTGWEYENKKMGDSLRIARNRGGCDR